MIKSFTILSTFLLLLLTPVFGQTPRATPDEDVVKITSKLVQLDAVVTDKDGRQVTDLKAEDFQVLQDGKPQKITFLTYVNTSAPQASAAPRPGDKNVLSVPPPRRSSNLGRILTFVVDDGNCSASNIGMRAARDAMEKFVREQMLPDDLVAIYKTRSGSSVLQQYTSDKARLLEAARKIRWYPPTGACATSDGNFFDAAKVNTFDKAGPNGSQTVTIESEEERKIREAGEDFGRSNQVVGTIGVLRYIIQGLQSVGGRKVVFLLSDGIPIRSRTGGRLDSATVLRDLTDQANRSAVVFNTIDVRGGFEASIIEARDSVSTKGDANATARIASDRTKAVSNSRDGMFFLADETGGNFYHGQNYLDVPIGKALGLEKGYYLIAYEPDDDTFKGKKFNNIEIRSTRPDLRILSRSGFIGTVADASKPKKRTGESELYDAIVAPLPKAGLDLRLTAYFVNTATHGNFVRSLINVNGKDVTFVNEPDGTIKAAFDVIAVTLNEKNEVVDEFNRTHTFRVDAAARPVIEANGLIYTTDVPIKKAGTYNFRVAIRDVNSKLLGSAGQIVDIPDLKKGGLMLSALTVAAVDDKGKFAIPEATKPENAFSVTADPAVPAIRQFRRGTVVAFAYTIYNARLEAAAATPNLTIQMNVYQNGNLISEGKPTPADLQKPEDWSRIKDFSYMRLGKDLTPGEYAMQIIVRNASAEKKQAASQSIDFEIVK